MTLDTSIVQFDQHIDLKGFICYITDYNTYVFDTFDSKILVIDTSVVSQYQVVSIVTGLVANKFVIILDGI